MGAGRTIRVWFFIPAFQDPPWFYLLFHPWITTSNIWKWIVQGEIHTDKAKDFIEKGTGTDSSKVSEPRRRYGNRVSFPVVSGQSSCSFPCLVRLRASLAADASQSRWVPAQELLGRHIIVWHLLPLWPLPSSSGLAAACLHRVLYQDLVLRDDSCKGWLLCLIGLSGFHLWFLNNLVS